MKLKMILLFLLISISNYAQNEKPEYDYEIMRTEIVYQHNADSTLTKLYNKNNELLNGKYRIIHEDSVVIYVNFKSGLWDGLYKSYYKTGELYAVILFENGIKKGIGIWYFKNGNKNREISYLNRQQHGVCKWYYENGNIFKECEFINDKENGKSKWYYENGTVQLLITYKNGLKNGLSVKYKQDGTIENQLYFLNNKKVSKDEFDKSE